MNTNTAEAANGEHMAAARAEYRLHAGHKGIQHVVGDECLRRTGKSAAVDAERTLTLQQSIAHSKSHILVPGLSGGSDVLQVHPGAAAGFFHQLQERVEIVCFQRFCTRLFSC